MSARHNARIVLLQRRRRFGEWPQTVRLAEPVDPLDTFHLARARSILCGIVGLDVALTPAQARDVCTWADYRPLKPSWWARLCALWSRT